MKILCFADLHAHNYTQYATRLSNGLNSRLVDCLNVVEQIRNVCMEQDVKHVVFAGDMFKSRTKIDVDSFVETWTQFFLLSQVLEELVLLCGNHDQFTRAGDIHCLEPFQSFSTVVSHHVPLRLSGVDTYFIPHIADYDTLRDALASIPYGTRLAFMHQPVAEAIPGPTDNPGKPKFKLDDVPWQRVDLVVSGDIHKRQLLRAGKWHYIGSPLQLTFGDRDQEKCASIIDTDTLEITDVPLSAPKFVQLESPENAEMRYEEFDLQGADPDKDFIRLRYFSDWEKQAELLKEKHPRIVLERYGDTQQAAEETTDAVVGNDRLLLQEYIQQHADESLDVDKLLEFGLDALAGQEVRRDV